MDQTSDEDVDIDAKSLFSKFSTTKRPAGFFGTQPGENNNHSGEIEIIMKQSLSKEKQKSPKRRNLDDTINKSDQKGVGSPKIKVKKT